MMNTLDTSSRDVISSLPDEILGDILSLLPTKQAASTSVLAKKWRNVFRLVHNFDFDDSDLLKPEEGKQESDEIWESFVSFVDRTLQYCDTPIKKFSLNCYIYNESETAHVTRWLCKAVERGVSELSLRNTWYGPSSLPSQLLTSKTLVKLTLGTNLCDEGRVQYVTLYLPSYVSLPSLKILLVHTVCFEDRDLSDLLLAGCPVLEELVVHHNDIAIPHTIISHSVKRLILDYMSQIIYHDTYSLSLDLPNLVYLDYSGFALTEYPQADLDSLLEAKLDLHPVDTYESDLTELIVGLRNVEILHLSRDSVDVISRCVKVRGLVLPIFNNLVNLSFGSKNKRSWKLLVYLLMQSPNLETLSLEDLNCYRAGSSSMALNKVKTLHVLGYRGTLEESKQLKSLLGKHKCLEMVQVDVVEEDDGRILQTKTDLLMLLGVLLPSKCEFKVV